MSEQLRQVVQASAPTQVAAVDAEEMWRRGRQRRRTTQTLAAVACVGVFVVAGWSVQQLTAPASLTVVEAPDEGRPQDLQVQPDAVWREPADDAVDAVEQFTATAFDWAASDLIIEGVTETEGPVFATVSHRPTNVSVTILLTPAPEQQWQVVQVQSEDTTGGTLTPREIQLPVPAGAATMNVHAFVDGRTVHYRGAADAVITAEELDSPDMDMIGGALVVYRDAAGEVVGAHGGHFGTGSEQPTEPSTTPTADGDPPPLPELKCTPTEDAEIDYDANTDGVSDDPMQVARDWLGTSNTGVLYPAAPDRASATAAFLLLQDDRAIAHIDLAPAPTGEGLIVTGYTACPDEFTPPQ